VDVSERMLSQAAELQARRVIGDVRRLPFDDGVFDLVVSAWVIETIEDPNAAVGEMLRVLRPGGLVLYTFCRRPDRLRDRLLTFALRAAVRAGFAGRFLATRQIPWHECGRSHIVRFRGGLVAEVALASCCTVRPAPLPTGAAASPDAPDVDQPAPSEAANVSAHTVEQK